MFNLPAKSNGETIRQHTDKLLSDFEKFKSLYGKYFSDIQLKEIEIACEYHDYGKTTYIFQKSIKNQKIISSYDKINKMYSEIGFPSKLPHGYISPAFIDMDYLKKELNNDKTEIKNVITAIYHHHNRNSDINLSQIKRIINEDLLVRYPDIKLSAKYKNHIFGRNFFISADSDDENCIRWINYAIIIGMLNKFDYHASAEEKDKLDVEIDGCYEGAYIDDKVKEYFSIKKYDFREIQNYTANNQDKNLIITASTGIGKTEAALLWCGKRKIFYTLPLKVSINAMYDRISNEYGYSPDKVTLLHSDAFAYISEENENDDEQMSLLKYQASQRFSFPVTVCTVDQLFTFVYKYRGCERIFATLKYSKVIIDEIQSYEPELIAKIIYGLKLITMAGGQFAIITATLPPILTYFIEKEKIPHDIPKQFLIEDKIRHQIHYEENADFDYNFINSQAKNKKILIICNTVRRACEVYKKLRGDSNDVWLLHSNFIRKHRAILEKNIIAFADEKNHQTGIWISTQIVEASLDIDFDMLFTEMCTADSLLQRMGRCYRKRDYLKKNTDNMPNVYILNNYNGYGTVYKYKDIFDRSVEFLMDYNEKYFLETDKIKYINKVYEIEGIKNSDYFEKMNDCINDCKNIVPFIFDAKDSKQKFRNIQTYTVIPKSVYDENDEKIRECIEILTGKSKKYNDRLNKFYEKKKARKFIENNSLQISSRYDTRAKECSNSLFNGLDYYTINYKYQYSDDEQYNIGLTYDFDIDSLFS